jgi:aspartate beta-hydroxylase
MTSHSLQQLAEMAQAAARSGERQRAQQLWESVLRMDPGEPRALNFLGNAALNAGNAAGAVALLEQAVAREKSQPAIWYNFALALRTQLKLQPALDALSEALTIDPYFIQALILKASILEQAGQTRAAAQFYASVLKVVGDQVVEQEPLAGQIKYAREKVADETSALAIFLEQEMLETLSSLPDKDQKRLQDCVDAISQKRKVYYPEPTFMNFPGLPVVEFFNTQDFSWSGILESSARNIQMECEALLHSRLDAFKAYVSHPADAPLNQWRELNNNEDWSAFYLWKDGVRQDENCSRCPNTAALLEQIPRAVVPGRAPSAFFSILKPHTHIPPHTGVTNTRVIVHLPLIIPEKCWFRVGAQTRVWEVGKALIFDDSIEHEAMNGSDEVRAVLIFDIWNPHLSEAECHAIALLVQKYGEFQGTNVSQYSNA